MTEPGMTPNLIVLRLVLAAVIGGVLGYERRVQGRPKAMGIAAMMLVAIGTTTYMLLAQYEAGRDRSLTGRTIQSTLQGIGFLAGAVIYKQGVDVKGIKTAATIWITSAIGLAVGTGFWWLGIIIGAGTAVLLWVTDLLTPAENRDDG